MTMQNSGNENVQKTQSMLLQKKMIGEHFENLSHAHENNKKVVYTFVPGNLNELIWAFDMLPVHPEINALQSGMRKKSGDYILEAEKHGHSEDVCTYVKCDIGMMKKGNIGPTGTPIPEPDLLLLSYTGCFTFMKWFELLKQEYDCPIVMLHVPYQGDGEITNEMKDYVVRQIKDEVIPMMEKISGKKLDYARLEQFMQSAATAENDLNDVWQMAKQRPSPIDAYFGGVYYVGPIFTAFRGLPQCEDYYSSLKEEVAQRVADNLAAMTPEGTIKEEKYRLVVEGPPNWTSFREFWKMFYDEGAVVVAASYTRVGGVYDEVFRHDRSKPFVSMAEYCLGCYTNLNLPSRIKFLSDSVKDFAADGFLINSIKSCNSFSAGQLLILNEVEKKSGVPGGFVESDLVDPRYFSAANIKNRLESYFQMLAAKKGKH